MIKKAHIKNNIFALATFAIAPMLHAMEEQSAAAPASPLVRAYALSTTMRTRHEHVTSLDYCDHDHKIIIQTPDVLHRHNLETDTSEQIWRTPSYNSSYSASQQLFISCRSAAPGRYEEAQIRTCEFDQTKGPFHSGAIEEFIIEGPVQVSPKGDLLVYCSNNTHSDSFNRLPEYKWGDCHCSLDYPRDRSLQCANCQMRVAKTCGVIGSLCHGKIGVMRLNSDGYYKHKGYLDSMWDFTGSINLIKISSATNKIACCDSSKFDTITLYDITLFAWIRRLFNNPSFKNLVPKFSWTQELTGHRGTITSMDFSPDDTTLASGSHDTTIRLWKRNPESHEYEAAQVLEGHTGAINTVRFAPSSPMLASGSNDHTIRIWQLSMPENRYIQSQLIQAHDQPVLALAFSSDDNNIVSGARNEIRLWQREPLAVPESAAAPLEQPVQMPAVARAEAPLVAGHPRLAESDDEAAPAKQRARR